MEYEKKVYSLDAKMEIGRFFVCSADVTEQLYASNTDTLSQSARRSNEAKQGVRGGTCYNAKGGYEAVGEENEANEM